jgi:hypothetical protein
VTASTLSVRRFCGLARIPTARTVGNWLRQFTRATLTALSQLNHELVTDAITRLALPRLTIDVDGTVVCTGATVGWAFRASIPIIGRTRVTTRCWPIWPRRATSSG